MASPAPFLSIIIPAYNEEKRIETTLTAIVEYLQTCAFSFEIIVVNDGSRDATTQVVELQIQGLDNAKLMSYQPNRGKGYAVRQGVLASKGEIVIFTDADLSTPIAEIEPALRQIEKGFDIVIGSRALANSDIARYQPLYRRMGSKIFNMLRDVIVGANISRFSDSQCGFKVFRGDIARKLFGLLSVNGFMFDVEMLYVATLLGYCIDQMAVHWEDMPGSKLRLFSDTVRMFKDLAAIRFAHRDLKNNLT